MTTREAIIRSAIVVILATTTVVLCNAFPNAATNPQTGMDLVLPEEIPGFVTEEIKPGEKELYWLPEDTGILKRRYIMEGARSRGDFITTTLILSGSDARSLHRPEVCLDGQGFMITSREVVTIEVNGKKLDVMDFGLVINERQEDDTVVPRRAHYVYWWIGKDRSTPSDFKRILFTALDNIFRNVNNRWGYPSVMVWVDEDLGGEGDRVARSRAYKFIRDHAPVFQKSLR